MILKISINLLPQSHLEKEKSSRFLIIPITGLVVITTAASFLTYAYFDLSTKVDLLNTDIIEKTTLRADLQQTVASKTNGITDYNFSEKYVSVDELMKSTYKDTVQLKSTVYQFLPQDASINSYSYTNNGNLNVTVTFASKGDAAIYLHRLLQADFVESAVVNTITSATEEIIYTSQFDIKLKTLVGEQL